MNIMVTNNLKLYQWNVSWDRDKEIQSQRNINYQLARGGLKKHFESKNLKSHTDNKKGKKTIIVKIWQEQKEDDMYLQRLNSKKNRDLGPKWQGLVFLDSREPSLNKFNNESQYKPLPETF